MWTGVLLSVVVVFVAAKTVAYLWEMTWFMLRGTDRLLPAYRADPERTYPKDHARGRPRLFLRRTEGENVRIGWKVWGALFKTPVVVAILFVGVAVTASGADTLLLVAAATVATLLGVVILLVPVVMRLVLGPYDVLNPDLRLPSVLAARIYEGRRNSLGIYILVLIAMIIVCFGASYDALGSIPGVLLPGSEHSSDPIRWLYSAVNISATEGLGDVTLRSNWVRCVVGAQMLLGPLALAWIASSFFGEQMPPPAARNR